MSTQTLSSIKFYAPIFLAITFSILLGILSHFLLYKFIFKRYPQSQSPLSIFFKYMSGPLFVIFPLFYITITSSLLEFKETSYIVSLIVKISFIIAASWSILKLVDYSDIWIERKYKNNGQNFAHSGIITRFYLLKKIARIVTVVIALSLLLLSFDSVREIGKGIIFSASVIGAVVVLAAQKLFSNIISGFQIAFTKPIQIGDNVKVGTEFGSIEEITLTYIIIRTWDLRKLVIPLSYLMEKPFENWTQLKDNNLLGIVFFYTDYSIPLAQIRKRFTEIVESTLLWNKQLAKLEVTELSERTMELRALVSAANADDLWDLRCYVREKLIEYVVDQFPQSLPKIQLSNLIQAQADRDAP